MTTARKKDTHENRQHSTYQSAGDAFTIYPGCDKQQSTCSAKFNNLIHFRGFPYVPENSAAV